MSITAERTRSIKVVPEEVATRLRKRSEASARGDKLMNRGEQVIWYRGVPIPSLEDLANPDFYGEWLHDLWSPAQKNSVCAEIPVFLTDLTAELAAKKSKLATDESGVQVRSHPAVTVYGTKVDVGAKALYTQLRREIVALSEYLIGFADTIDAIAENCSKAAATANN
jgi:hypothetical protein